MRTPATHLRLQHTPQQQRTCIRSTLQNSSLCFHPSVLMCRSSTFLLQQSMATLVPCFATARSLAVSCQPACWLLSSLPACHCSSCLLMLMLCTVPALPLPMHCTAGSLRSPRTLRNIAAGADADAPHVLCTRCVAHVPCCMQLEKAENKPVASV